LSNGERILSGCHANFHKSKPKGGSPIRMAYKKQQDVSLKDSHWMMLNMTDSGLSRTIAS
jgi:hypothetical protein